MHRLSSETKPVSRLVSRQRRLLLYYAICDATTFKSLRGRLCPEAFEPADPGLALVWRLACTRTTLPSIADLRMAVDAVRAGRAAKQAAADAADEFLRFAKELSDEGNQLPPSCFSCDMARRLMLEYVARQASEELAAGMPMSLQEVLNRYNYLAGVANRIGLCDDIVSLPEGWDRKAQLNIESTGIEFLDEFMGGGHAPGEVYGLLGTYGGFKTTMATMLAVESARRFAQQAAAASSGEPPRRAFVVSYEANVHEMRRRTIACAARVSYSRMCTMRLHDLSQTGHLVDYERQLFRDRIAAGQEPLGEQERAEQAIGWLNRHLTFLDMSGCSVPGTGRGYLPEIAQRVNETLRKEKGSKCGLIVIDCVGAMAERHIAAHSCDPDHRRQLVASAGLLAQAQLAARFNCPMWLVHHLSGEANDRSPGAVLHHGDAADAKNFAENLDFAFILGFPNSHSRLPLTCTKHRRQPARDGVLLQSDGEMQRVSRV